MRVRIGISLALATGVLAAGLVACGGDDEATSESAAPATGEATDVVFNVGGSLNGKHAALFLAQQKGFFAKHGVNVSFVPGEGSGLALQQVVGGRVQFAATTLSDVALSTEQGGGAKAIMAMFEKNPTALASLAGKLTLATPQALKGKRLGIPPGSAIQVMYPVLLAENGMTKDDVEEVNINFNVFVQSLLQGRVDAIPAFTNESFCVSSKAAGGADKLSLLKFPDWNVNLYDQVYVASDKLIAEQPAVVEGFVRGAQEGYAYMAAHPDEAVAATVAAAPEVEEDVAKCQVDATIDAGESTYFDEHGYGALDTAKVERDMATLADAHPDLDTAPAVDAIYDPQFVEK